MSEFEQIEIKREWIHQASEIARKCSSEATRQRVLVSQAVGLATANYLHRKFNLSFTSGRSSDAKFTELLDVCDYRCHQWNIEMRTVMTEKNFALFVPTMPLMVGFFSDFYVGIQVDKNLSRATILGYAARQQLNNSELTPNGMFAVLSVEKLSPISMLAPNIKQTEDRIEELNERLETRTRELEQERQCSIGGVQFIGSAMVLLHPERENPNLAPMVRDEEIERIAIQTVTAEAESEGWVVESVESENRGFDLILRKFSAEDVRNCTQVRFVEVKGRAGIGEVGLSSNEFKTAERLRDDFWLYVVYNCANEPELHKIQNPARLGWQPVVRVEQYHISSKEIIEAEKA
jgi:hypothetical protein